MYFYLITYGRFAETINKIFTIIDLKRSIKDKFDQAQKASFSLRALTIFNKASLIVIFLFNPYKLRFRNGYRTLITALPRFPKIELTLP